MNLLAARKQALVAESELYRQALALELQELKASTARIKKNFNFLRWLKPIILFAPLAGSLLGLRSSPKVEKPRPTGWRKWCGGALVGWRLYRQAVPMISRFIPRRRASRRRVRETTHSRLRPSA
jgi:hypothetical protein